MAKGNGKACTKAPPKKVVTSKNGAPKKAPSPQNKSKNKGSRKRVADDTSSDSTGEEPDPRPQKKHCGKQKEISDEEEDGASDEVEVMQVDDAEPQSDNEVQIFKVTIKKVNCDLQIGRGGWAPYPTPDIHHIGGPYPEGQSKRPSTNFF